MFSLDELCYVLAAQTTLVVGRTCQHVLNASVNENQSVTCGFEGEVLVLKVAAVEADEAACLAEYAGKLVHNTALNANVVVLCSLAHLSKLKLVNLVVAEHIVQSESECALQSCR